MFHFLKRLWRDRRGNALVIAGAALPLVVGSAGLASDTIQWAMWKRQLQRVADSAALAGTYAQAANKSLDNCSAYATATYSSPIGYDVKTNNTLSPTLTCSATNPPTVGAYTADTHAVRVSVSVQKRLPFSGLFLSAVPTITAAATATMVQTGQYCLVALNNTSDPGITVGGSSNANLGCGAITNSTSSDNSVSPNGNAYYFAANPIAAVGGLPSSIIGSSNLQPNHIGEPDPFAGKYPTDVPASTTCTSFISHGYTTNQNGQVVSGNPPNSQKHLTAGCYNDFSPSGNNTYYLDAGVYYLNSTDFNPGGTTTLIGSGVTFILTGTSPGVVSLSGNQTLKLSGPTTGTYAKMLFIQSSAATTNNQNLLNGTSASYFDGAMYFPNGQVQLNGTTGVMTQCAMIVAWTVDITGNATLQNDTSSCHANETVPAWIIRLVE
jgi:Flp pilus assembly protein TadG